VDEKVIMRPNELTPEEIMQENNQEVKRVMLERYGWEKILLTLKAEKINEDQAGILYKTNRLGEYLEREDPEARFVLVQDPSTDRRYCLRVPPTVKTAKEAVAWTFDTEAKAYNPSVET
jgi:hypothetical protein